MRRLEEIIPFLNTIPDEGLWNHDQHQSWIGIFADFLQDVDDPRLELVRNHEYRPPFENDWASRVNLINSIHLSDDTRIMGDYMGILDLESKKIQIFLLNGK